ncbi:hypothetical protein FGG08_003794 [Glutinoglossum americanum]|uniref:RmlD-like substrate binding domain-containing protein n=1 Tax=Glutinoglossum americanum TaxID=1670608 RepID=A0A9P8I8X6_9PEZI|nr:hypothetical protein FGG08_003794 [Glutinoglossum americanum]
MTRRALVTGATGLLGRQVVKAFDRAAGWEAVGTGFTRANPPSILKVDLCNKDDVEKTLDAVKPQVVVHCAANRFPDKCDIDPVGTKALNIQASQNLAHAANSRSILLIYISTDYVFPGRPGDAPYETDASPSPTNLYGESKLDGERAVIAETISSGLGVVLRVPVLYGEANESKESAVNVLLDSVWKAQEKDATISMDDWALRYPTNTEDVGRVTKDIATKYLDTADKKNLPKILQFSSEDKFTKYGICQLFAEIMGLPLDGMMANKEGNDPNASVQRPYDCHLSTKALKELEINVGTQNFRDWW